jgi:hypothetical protein
MHYVVSIRTAASRQALDERLRKLTAGGPFRVDGLDPVGAGTWDFHLTPTRADMVVGFGKVAELLVLLAREFEVQAVVGRIPSRSVAAAS